MSRIFHRAKISLALSGFEQTTPWAWSEHPTNNLQIGEPKFPQPCPDSNQRPHGREASTQPIICKLDRNCVEETRCFIRYISRDRLQKSCAAQARWILHFKATQITATVHPLHTTFCFVIRVSSSVINYSAAVASLLQGFKSPYSPSNTIINNINECISYEWMSRHIISMEVVFGVLEHFSPYTKILIAGVGLCGSGGGGINQNSWTHAPNEWHYILKVWCLEKMTRMSKSTSPNLNSVQDGGHPS